MDHITTVLPQDMVRAGTGEMYGLTQAIERLQQQGYTCNIVQKFDHFTCSSGRIKLYPKDLFFDEVLRFENTSDPDDQAIMYAIRSLIDEVKGLYVESYGLYHDELSTSMIHRMQECHQIRQKSPHPGGTGVAL